MQFIATSLPDIAKLSQDGGLLTSVDGTELSTDESAFIDVYKMVAVEKSSPPTKRAESAPSSTQTATPAVALSVEESGEEQQRLVDFLDRVNAFTARQPSTSATADSAKLEVELAASAPAARRSLIARAVEQATLETMPIDKAVPVLPIDDEITLAKKTVLADEMNAVFTPEVDEDVSLQQLSRPVMVEIMEAVQLSELPQDKAAPVLPITDEVALPKTTTFTHEMNTLGTSEVDVDVDIDIPLYQPSRRSVMVETMEAVKLNELPQDKAAPVLPIDDGVALPKATTVTHEMNTQTTSEVDVDVDIPLNQPRRPVMVETMEAVQLNELPQDKAVPVLPIDALAAEAVTVQATTAPTLPEQQIQAQQIVPMLRAMLAEVSATENSSKQDNAKFTALIQESIETLTQGTEAPTKVVEQLVQTARDNGIALPASGLFDSIKDAAVQPLTPRVEAQGQSASSNASATTAAASLGNSDNPINIIKEEGQQQLAEKIRWLVSSRQPFAEIRLDPPEMGSMQIRVNVSGDSTSISILVQQAQTREWLNDALPRLRDMLQEQGLQLADAAVSQQGQQKDKSQQGNNADFSAGSGGGDESDDTVVLEQALTPQRQGGIDAYA